MSYDNWKLRSDMDDWSYLQFGERRPGMRSERSIRVGDQVMYSAVFLRSIGCYSGALPFARGRVKRLARFGASFLVTVAWDNSQVPKKVLISNLVRKESPK